ncbi:MAG: hypothetical protein Q3972_09260, partial [Corynebacterium sp.]|nr:hypothetical protein [Corynebacterium sp.]
FNSLNERFTGNHKVKCSQFHAKAHFLAMVAVCIQVVGMCVFKHTMCYAHNCGVHVAFSLGAISGG